ncbi:hypothetical protein M758_4G131400 [Ceratodon purpureus]|nr:hypothetical protein M758_4G131400 [Ceratodon purpureus]
MVFDEWHNSIPVAFILTSRCAEKDLTPWMTALNSRMTDEKPDWRPATFIVDCAQGEINAIKYSCASGTFDGLGKRTVVTRYQIKSGELLS